MQKTQKKVEIKKVRPTIKSLTQQVEYYRGLSKSVESFRGEITMRDNSIVELKRRVQSMTDQRNHMQRVAHSRFHDVIRARKEQLDLLLRMRDTGKRYRRTLMVLWYAYIALFVFEAVYMIVHLKH